MPGQRQNHNLQVKRSMHVSEYLFGARRALTKQEAEVYNDPGTGFKKFILNLMAAQLAELMVKQLGAEETQTKDGGLELRVEVFVFSEDQLHQFYTEARRDGVRKERHNDQQY